VKTLALSLEQIEVGDRLRGVDPDWAQALADSMAELGQLAAIEVRNLQPGAAKAYALVTGAHRLRALELLGRTEVFATVVELDELQARLHEITENLMRHELTVLDRATFMAERKAVYEALHPETKHGDINRFAPSGQFVHSGAGRFTKERRRGSV